MKKPGYSPIAQEAKMKPGFWDTRVQDPLVEEAIKYVKGGSALDIGAGWPGRDAFYLADMGFAVTAVEIDKECLKELRRRNQQAEHKISIIKADVRTYKPKGGFDVIVSDMVLHFLNNAQEVRAAVEKMQSWTLPGGVNVIMAYTTKNPKGKRPYLFKENELAGYYKDWEMLQYVEMPTPWFHLSGEPEPRRNEAAYLLARKPVDGRPH